MKPNQIKNILLIALANLIIGCSNNAYIAKSDIDINNINNNGIAVMSLNLEGIPKGFHYIVKSLDSGINFKIPEYTMAQELLPMLPTDFDDVKAKIIVLNLPAGKYSFTEWSNTTCDQYGNCTTQGSKKDFPILFDVPQKSINYIGEISQTNTYSFVFITRSDISIQDKSERDLPVFLKKYTNINSTTINTNLAHKMN
jgi:hypothetical protein